MFLVFKILSLFSLLISPFYVFGQNIEESRTLHLELETRSNEKNSIPFSDIAYKLLVKNPDSSLHYALLIESKARSTNNLVELSRAIHIKALVMLYKGEINKSIDLFDETIRLTKLTGDNQLLQFALIDKAGAYYRKNKFRDALSNALNSKKLAETSRDTAGILAASTFIGSLYIDLENYGAAKAELLKLLEISLSVDLPIERSYVNYNLGNLYLMYNSYDSSILYSKETINLAKQNKDNYLGQLATFQLAHALLKKREILLAEKTIEELLQSSEYIVFEELESENLLVLAELQLSKSNYLEALKFCWKAKNLSLSNGTNYYEASIYELLFKIYDVRNEIDSAHFYLKKFKSLRDSIRTANLFGEISNWNYEYELNKKQLSEESLKSKLQISEERTKTRTIYVFILIVFLILSIIAIVIVAKLMRQKQISNKKLKRQHSLIKKSMNEVNRLNREIQSKTSHIIHDLRSPLSTVSAALELIKDSELGLKYGKYVETASSELKRCQIYITSILKSSQDGQWVVEFSEFQLSDMISQIFNQHKCSLKEKNIQLNISVDDKSIINSDKLALERILNNLISNAIKYSPSQSIIQLSAIVDKRYLNLEVTDEGSGFSDIDKLNISKKITRFSKIQSDESESFGLGLASVFNLVKSLNGVITLDSNPGSGSSFKIKIPI